MAFSGSHRVASTTLKVVWEFGGLKEDHKDQGRSQILADLAGHLRIHLAWVLIHIEAIVQRQAYLEEGYYVVMDFAYEAVHEDKRSPLVYQINEVVLLYDAVHLGRIYEVRDHSEDQIEDSRL